MAVCAGASVRPESLRPGIGPDFGYPDKPNCAIGGRVFPRKWQSNSRQRLTVIIVTSSVTGNRASIPEVAVKLSAPPSPPPTPEQPEPGQPNSEAGAQSPSPPAPENAPAALTWPAWFAGADFLLAALAMVLAFLLASFVARNSDVWVHLAAGQRLLSGDYRPGTDPFSYSAADRAWVNHSLLYDVGTYVLFRADPTGAMLVVVKALAIALAFGLLLSLRRPGHALWPWAAVGIVAALAAAPRFHLSPLVGSILLLAVTLVLVFRMPHRPNSWRFPIAIGITFWIWAMVDSWFFIGPLALGLILIGELAQRMMVGPSSTDDEGHPLGNGPDPSTLAKALALGVIACMFNPHHVRIWELPFELVGVEGASGDIRFKQILMSPLNAEYSKSDQVGRTMGYNLNGLAYVLLFVGGGLALGLGAGRLRFAHLALWVGFALLSLASIYAIPFFAVVSVPLIAAQLNTLSARVGLKSWGDPRTRFILLGSASGRVITLVAAVVVCVLAWPGWAHPSSGDPAFARRVAWGIHRDGGYVLAAEQLEAWRKNGSLPPEARGLIVTTELANYCAWFAPSEKVFMNARYNHHRAELPQYLTFRKDLELIKSDDAPNQKQLDESLRNLGIEYVAVSAGPGDGTRLQTRGAAVLMWVNTQRWSPWYLNGRSMIAGWRGAPGAEKPTFNSLRLDPIAQAFGPGVERLEPGQVKPIPPQMGWEREFIRGVNPSPAGADEALGWIWYGEIRAGLVEAKLQAVHIALILIDRTVSPGATIRYFSRHIAQSLTGEMPEVDELTAIPFLALRAARRAIAADPDHPDGYLTLSYAFADPSLGMSEDERVLARVTALRQFLKRLPPPERYRKGAYLAPATSVAKELFLLYSRGISLNNRALIVLREGFATYAVQVGKDIIPVPASQLRQNHQIVAGPFLFSHDTARDILLEAEKYLPIDFENEEERKRQNDELQTLIKAIDAQYRTSNNFYERKREEARNRGLQMKLKDQVEAALQNNLVEEALRLLADPDLDLTREFGRDALKFALIHVALKLGTGRLEEAANDLEFLPTTFDEVEAAAPKDFAQHVRQLRDPLRMQLYQKLVLEGNYAEAGTLMEQTQGRIVVSTGQVDPPEKMTDFTWPTGGVTWSIDLVARMRLWFGGHLNRYESVRNAVAAAQAREGEFFFRRGLLSLIEGDVAGAKKRFEQAAIPAVEDWGLPERRNPQAERLLRLIRRAEKSEK